MDTGVEGFVKELHCMHGMQQQMQMQLQSGWRGTYRGLTRLVAILSGRLLSCIGPALHERPSLRATPLAW